MSFSCFGSLNNLETYKQYSSENGKKEKGSEVVGPNLSSHRPNSPIRLMLVSL
jgi:hypothetical protein